jgi:hypothetical protein
MPDIFFWILLPLTVVGLALLVWVIGFWPYRINEWYSEGFAKSVVELVQLAASVATVFVTIAAANDKPKWFDVLIVAVVCVTVWRIAQFIADWKSKAGERAKRAALESMQRTALSRVKLLSILRGLLRKRVERIERARMELPPGGYKASISTMRGALDPERHINDVLEALVGYFQSLRPDTSETHQAEVRIGLYIAQGGQAVPVEWFSVKQRSREIYRSFREQPDHFRLNCQERPAHVVRCLNERRAYTVEDCEAAAEADLFRYFSHEQRSYLKSLFVCPLGDLPIVDESGSVEFVRSAIVADSDLPRYFLASEERLYCEGVDFFQTRLLLEFNLRVLMNTGGKS